jgi:hypothetical protein
MPLREELTDEVLARDARLGWTRQRVSDYELTACRNDPEWLSRYRQIFEGTSFTIMDTKTRLVPVPAWPVVDGELGRAYLRAMTEHYGTAPPYQRGVVKAGHMERGPALWCEPVRRMKFLSYVDLHHAYWSILRPHCWDTLHMLDGRVLTPLGGLRWIRPDEVAEDRGIRLAVPGTLFARGFAFYHWGKWTEHPRSPGSFTQPSLYHIVFSTMHAIAADVIRHFPVHAWLTDACIIDAAAEDDVRGFLAERWALASSVKGRGMGQVFNVGSYRIGGWPYAEHRYEIKRWSRDQDDRNDKKMYRAIRKVSRVNVIYWRNLRKENRAKEVAERNT